MDNHQPFSFLGSFSNIEIGTRTDLGSHRGNVLGKEKKVVNLEASWLGTREALDTRSVFAVGQWLRSEAAWEAGETNLERQSCIQNLQWSELNPLSVPTPRR